MADDNPYAKMVPGFDFLQNMLKSAGQAMPAVGQWIAPTIDPKELEKRIEELKTVQFWLEQNARIIAASIQALEVQRMTLSTLQSMNVSMNDLRETLTAKVKPAAPAAAPEPRRAPEAPAEKVEPAGTVPSDKLDEGAAGDTESPAPGVIDPMKWWGALTRQFSDIAASTLKESGAQAARDLADAMVQKPTSAPPPSAAAAVPEPRRAVSPAQAPGSAAGAVPKTAAKAAARKTLASTTAAKAVTPAPRSAAAKAAAPAPRARKAPAAKR
jgi:hypothetical protein